MVPPTLTSAGLALMPSIAGQTFRVPETMTLPVRGASWQATGTATLTALPAATANIAEPPQLTVPSVVMAVIVIWKPAPAGRPPMVAVSVLDAADVDGAAAGEAVRSGDGVVGGLDQAAVRQPQLQGDGAGRVAAFDTDRVCARCIR